MKDGRSFQARLTILASLVSGVILLAFGLASWFAVRQQFLHSVDARLLVPAERLAHRLHIDAPWDRLFEEWRNQLDGEGEIKEGRLFYAIAGNGEPLFKSADSEWISGVDLSAYYPQISEPAARNPSLLEENDPLAFLDGPPDRPMPRGPKGKGMPPDQNGRPPGERDGERPEPPSFETFTDSDGQNWRVIIAGSPHVTLFTGVNMKEFQSELAPIRRFFFAAVPLGLIAIAGGGWLIARRALRPLKRIAETANHVTATGLDQRIPVTGREFVEFSQLIKVLNGMMERLETSFHQATRFTADASHELKTPIALMQAEVEAALRNCEPGSQEQAALVGISHEVQRLKRITQSLLLLSQIDAGHFDLEKERVNLSDEMRGLAEDAAVLCEGASLRLETEIGDGIYVEADTVLLMQSAQNLLSNAIKYNQPDGWVRCSLKHEGEEAVIRFENSGPGIPFEEQERVFQRFYRIDKARGRESDGFGLGLNLAKEIVRVHGGRLRLEGTNDEKTVFAIRLPAVDAGSEA